MKEIRSKDFEYYENKAAYFAYTHDDGDIYCPFDDEYEELDKKVIESVKELGVRDRVNNIPKMSFEQLSRYIVSEGWLTRDEMNRVIIDLFVDYLREYNASEEKTGDY